MSAKLFINDKYIELSQEDQKLTIEQLTDKYGEKERKVYYPNIIKGGAVLDKEGELRAWESFSEQNILWIEALLELKNWADKHNGAFVMYKHYFHNKASRLEISYCVIDFEDSNVFFSSEEIAEQARKELGDELILTALNVKT